MAQKVSWDRYGNGEVHELTEQFIREEYGLTVTEFRNRFVKYCRRVGMPYSAYRSRGELHFRVQK